MRTLDEIKAEIEALPQEDYAELRKWLTEKDWEEWDAQLEADSEAGELDFLIEEARHDEHTRRL
jgi:hypothetical protein